MQKKFYALFFTAIMIAGFVSPFILLATPSTAAVSNQINPAWPLVTLLTPSTNPSRQQWALVIANSFQSFGIPTVRAIVPWGTMYDRMLTPAPAVVGLNHSQGGFDMGFVGYALSPNPNPYGLFHSTQFAPGGQNYYLWNDSYNDALLYNITHTLDQTTRINYAKQWQAYAYDNLPCVTLFYTREVVAFKPSFQSAPFLTWHYPMWPAVEQWNDTLGSTSVAIAQTGPISESLLPYVSTSYYDLTIYGSIYGELGGFGLTKRDSSFNVVPYMAYGNYTATVDGKNWTFWLRPNIKFHNGETVTGKDWVYTVRYMMTPTSGAADSGVYSYIAGIICGADRAAGIAAGYGNRSVYWAGEPGTPGASLPYNEYEIHFDEQAPWAFSTSDIAGIAPLPASILVNSSSGIPNYPSWDASQAYVLRGTSFGTGLDVNYVYYGKNGSLLTGNGPVGCGPYRWHGYDPVTFIAHEEKFSGYWNRAALEAAGVYRFQDFYIYWIEGSTAAIAALSGGTVQVLDSQYHLESSLSSLLPAWSTWIAYDAYGVQEMGFNLENPIWGTGLATPNGRLDPANAKEYARHVRVGLEYLIPKDTIIKQILNGYGSIGVAEGICRVTQGFNFDIVLRNYTYAIALDHARAEFEAAGYTFGTPTPQTFWEAYGLIIAVVELGIIVVLGGFYFFRPRKL